MKKALLSLQHQCMHLLLVSLFLSPAVAHSQLCSAPVLGPSGLSFTAYSNIITGSFTAAVPAAAGYLVVRTASATPPAAPVNGVTYTAGSAALGGFIQSVGSSTAFSAGGLAPGSSWYFWVIPYYTGFPCSAITYFSGSKTSSTVNTLACNVLTNTLTLPETGNVVWSALSFSLGHLPTACENVLIVCNGSLPLSTAVQLDIDADLTVHNLTIVNNSTAAGNDKVLRVVVGSGVQLNITGDLSLQGAGVRAGDSVILAGGGTTTIEGNAEIGQAADNSFTAIGSNGNGTDQTFIFKGNLAFEKKAGIIERNSRIIMQGEGTQLLINNTDFAETGKLLMFDKLEVGNGTALPAVSLSGSNGDFYLDDNAGHLEIFPGASLSVPQNFTLNAKDVTTAGIYNSSLIVHENATLQFGGDHGGNSGSNFSARFSSYSPDPLSVIEYNGDGSITQTVFPGISYGNLVLSNGGGGRAAKLTAGGIVASSSLTINGATDLNLGSAVFSNGPLNVMSNGGLYCGANIVAGTGAFNLNDGATLGIGHAQGITNGGFATGNIQMSGGRMYSSLANYAYNGITAQVTGSGMPASCNDLLIDNPAGVTLLSGKTVIGNATLKQGVLDIGTFRLALPGTLTSVGGKMKADRGILELAATTGVQSISGSNFVGKSISTLINNNNNGISFTGTAADSILISSALLYGSGVTNSVINTNDHLSLLSRDTATARFGEIVTGSGNSITGNVTVERYIASGRKWQSLAWPTSSVQTAGASWMENSAIANANNNPSYGAIITDDQSGWNTNGFDSRSVSGPTVKYFNPATNAFTGIPNTSTFPMNSEPAYFFYVRGDRACLPANNLLSPTILRSTGTLKTGDQTFYVDANMAAAIGNPYASAIDLRALDTVNLTGTFYIWDPKLTGGYGLGAYQTLYSSGNTYRVLPGGGSYGAAGSAVDTVESGRAIFVHARENTGILTFHENAKTISAPSTARTANSIQFVSALLSLVDPGSNTLVDGTMAMYDSSFNNGVDYDDAFKMINTAENLSLQRDGQFLAIERRAGLQPNDTLFLNISGERVHQYQWDITLSNMEDTDRTALLVDNFLGTSTPLSFSTVNQLQFSVGAAGSNLPDRFMILFTRNLLPVTFTSITAARTSAQTATVKWTTATEINMASYTIERSTDGRDFTAVGSQQPGLNNGGGAAYSFIDRDAPSCAIWYRVKGTSANGQAQYTAIVKANGGEAGQMMSIYPNPVANGEVNISFLNPTKGTYRVTIFNSIGQAVRAESVTSVGESFVRILNLGNAAMPGTYRAKISDSAGNNTTIPFIIR